MSELELAIGFSPCPNDTFMFEALVHGRVAVDGVRFAPWLADIEELNARAAGRDPLPVTKLSVAALGEVEDRYEVLPAGAALGRGNGPLVVCRAGSPLRELGDLAGRTVAIPGARTTARLLLAIHGPRGVATESMLFSDIMPAVAAGRVDAGVVIHESRFTFVDHGLRCLADLGELWERATGLPLPLGVVAARRTLPRELRERIGVALRRSIELARARPELSREFVRAHAQELSEDVCRRHIELYVNDWSVELGDIGRRAIAELVRRGAGG
jgi:1,4-dihydroxy-6-naphthoate synthase